MVTRPRGGRTARRWSAAWVAFLALGVAGCTRTPHPDSAAPDAPDARDTAAALANGTWSRLPSSPVGSPLGPILAWDGHEVLQVGGITGVKTRADGVRTGGTTIADTVAYTPGPGTAASSDTAQQGRWRRLDDVPFPVSADDATAVWTGSRLALLTADRAALLDPRTGRWRAMSAPPLPRPASDTRPPVAVWDGQQIVVADVLQADDGTAQTRVAGYDPHTDRWTRTDPPSTAGHDPRGAPLVATPDGVVLFGLWSHSVSKAIKGGIMTSVASGIDVLRLSPDGHWSALAADWPQHEIVPYPLLTPVGIVVPGGQIWCGDCSHPGPGGEHGYLADPHTLRGHPMTRGPLDDTDPFPVWTGRALLTFADGSIQGPQGSIDAGDPAVWDPGTDRWTRLPSSPTGLDYRTAPIWAGHRLIAVDPGGNPITFLPATVSHTPTPSSPSPPS